jgi:hypothetical protein
MKMLSLVMKAIDRIMNAEDITQQDLVISKLLTRYRKIQVSIPSNFFTKGYLYGDSVSTSSNRFCIVGLMCIINIIIDVVFCFVGCGYFSFKSACEPQHFFT